MSDLKKKIPTGEKIYYELVFPHNMIKNLCKGMKKEQTETTKMCDKIERHRKN